MSWIPAGGEGQEFQFCHLSRGTGPYYLRYSALSSYSDMEQDWSDCLLRKQDDPTKLRDMFDYPSVTEILASIAATAGVKVDCDRI